MEPGTKKLVRLVLFIFCLSFNFLSYSQYRFLVFSGFKWKVSDGIATSSGNNLFRNDTTMQYVDSEGRLHLKIKKIHGIWYCSQIQMQEALGYGEYVVYLISDITKLDSRIVFGMLLEKDITEINLPKSGEADHKIAIQISKWNQLQSQKGWFSLYPLPKSCNWPFSCAGTYDCIKEYSIRIPTSKKTTYKLCWNNQTADNRKVRFQSYIGNFLKIPNPGYIMGGYICTGSQIPMFENEKMALNIWFFGSNAPVLNDVDEYEVIIQSVSFLPAKNAGCSGL